MLSRIQIKAFRGIERGVVDGLAPLTVLLGPNGSGKSAVLDALLIGSHPKPTEAVGRAVARRGLTDSARWLIRRADVDAEAHLEVTTPTARRQTVLRFREGGRAFGGYRGPYGQIDVQVTEVPPPEGSSAAGTTWFSYDDHHEPDGLSAPNVSPYVRLIDSFEPFDAAGLARTYDTLLRLGRLDATHALLRTLVRGAKELRIGVDAATAPLLHVVYEGEAGAVPLGLTGDGVKLAVRASMSLATAREGVMLFEEPDAHVHPSALWMLARGMEQATHGDVQVILSTHSLELVDALIAECAGDLSRLAVIQTRLRDGELVTARIDGDEARHDRIDLAEDLR